MSPTPKSIFIGGTGRCGTNILKDSLCVHPEAFGLGFESRFTIDPCGVIPTYQSIMNAWSPLNFNKTLAEFYRFVKRLSAVTPLDRFVNKVEYLLRKIDPSLSLRAYSHWELSRYFPSLMPLTEQLLTNLTAGRFFASWHGNNFLTREMYLPAVNSSNHEYVEEVFSAYLNQLIDEVLQEQGRRIFVDDNTFNILYATELVNLVPNSLMIHIYRDPRDVVASYVRQRWSPSRLDQAIDYYCSIMQRWHDIRPKVPGNRLLEIRFEEFVESPVERVNEIFSYFSISNATKESVIEKVSVEKAHINRWQEEFSEPERKQLNSRLEQWLGHYGYA